MVLLFAYFFLAIFTSFLCSILESVLLSTPISFLKVREENGKSWAKRLITMKDNIDRPLSAILSMNTVAHTIGAAGVGAQAVVVFGEAYFGLVSAILTLLILILTEIIPKTIGARYWRHLARFATITIRFMIVLTYPLVMLSAVITRMLYSKKKEPSTSREEVAALASIGAEEGVFREEEHHIIRNVIHLHKVSVTEIMTPRVVLVTANEDMPLIDFLANADFKMFTRIPVYKENDEHITGYVMRPTVLEKLAEDQHQMSLKEIRRDIIIVPNTVNLFSLWQKLLENREHLALIVDEYGGTDGIVTMEDILETLLGLEIVDESDAITDMQQYARELWRAQQRGRNFKSS